MAVTYSNLPSFNSTGHGSLAALGAAQLPMTKIVQSWPKIWAKFRLASDRHSQSKSYAKPHDSGQPCKNKKSPAVRRVQPREVRVEPVGDLAAAVVPRAAAGLAGLAVAGRREAADRGGRKVGATQHELLA